MSNQLVFTLVVFALYRIESKYNVCPITEDPKCANIMYDRYDITVEEFESLSPLHKFIMQDNINCIEEDLCPIMLDPIIGEKAECISGFATELNYPCNNIDLLSFIPLKNLGSHINASGADIWGWTQYDNNNNYIGYYALTGQSDGSSIVDITDPLNPNVLAFIKSNVFPTRLVIWRDIKIFGDFAFIVADAKPENDHHLQIVNIPNIINEAREYQSENGNNDEVYIVDNNNPNVIIYDEFGSSHNIHINEDSGYLYSVGIADCDGGIHIVDINNPLQPLYVGCYSDANYTHDIQCINYHGPDDKYYQHEICFAFTPSQPAFPSNASALTIVDVTDKQNIIQLSRTLYNFSAYTHQGWVTTNHEYLLMDDEGDEKTFRDIVDTQWTYIFDVRNLEKPEIISIYKSDLTVIDHNQYIIDNGKSSQDDGYKGFVFQTNYEAGLRILNIDNIKDGNIFEIAYFDNYIWFDANSTSHDTVNPRGSWSVYPYFKPNKNENEYSDVIVVQNINTGLYIFKTNINVNDIFDHDDTDSNTLSSTEIGLIIGGAVICVFILIGIVLYYMFIKHKSKSKVLPQEKSLLIEKN